MKTFKEYLAEKEETLYTHYSHNSGLTHLSGMMSGSGIKGEEQKRLAETKDPRIKKRVYFYPPVSGGLPRPEQGLGVHTYHAHLENMHDATNPSPEANKIALKAKEHIANGEHPGNAYESAVLDSGFHGYHTGNMSVVLNRDVKVKYAGSSLGKKFADHVVDTKERKKSVFDGIPNSEDRHTSSSLTGKQSIFWTQHKEHLQKAVPSMKMEYGRLSVHKDHLSDLKTELDKYPEHPF